MPLAARRSAACWPRTLSRSLNLPPFDYSAVDGYAVRGENIDATLEQRLAIVDRGVAAGHAAAHAIKSPGEAVRIFTGAPMRPVPIPCLCRRIAGSMALYVIVPPGLSRGANRRLAGEDIGVGAVALRAGRRLSARKTSLAAALGLTAVEVKRSVRVALFSTGDEIAEPGSPLAGAALYDLQPLSARRGGRALWRGGHRSRHSSR